MRYVDHVTASGRTWSISEKEDEMVEPSIKEGIEGGYPVLAVGYFFEDSIDVICVHSMDDREGAERCLDAEKAGE